MLDLLDYNYFIEYKGLIESLDSFKAFDTIEHKLMFVQNCELLPLNNSPLATIHIIPVK